MAIRLIVLLLLLCSVAGAQVVPYPQNNPLQIGKPSVPEATPIVQGGQMGLGASLFPGSLYSDAASCWGYNVTCAPGGTTVGINTADWGTAIVWEQDYGFPNMPLGQAGLPNSTFTSVDNSTFVYTDTARTGGTALTVNILQGYTLCDGGASSTACTTAGPGAYTACLIVSNTANTITCDRSLGATSGDNYGIYQRASELRIDPYSSVSSTPYTAFSGRAPIIKAYIDKGRTMAAGAMHMTAMDLRVPTDANWGLGFCPDVYDEGHCGNGSGYLANLIATGGTTLKLQPNLVNAGGVQIILNPDKNHNSAIYLNSGNGGGTYTYFAMTASNSGSAGVATDTVYNNGATHSCDFLSSTMSGSGTTAVTTLGCSVASSTIVLNALTTGTNADFLCLSAGNVILIQSSACTISSKRFKENIQPFHTDAVGEIASLPVDTFRLKGNNADPNASSEQIGLIAEDVARIEPRCAVYERDMKTPKSYRQECVIAMLVRAVQQQQEEIRQLRKHYAKSHHG